jgi:hypothetical protein
MKNLLPAVPDAEMDAWAGAPAQRRRRRRRMLVGTESPRACVRASDSGEQGG